VGQPRDGVLERSRTDGSLFGDRQIARAGRADEDRTAARGRRLRIGREIRRATELVELDARKSGREGRLLRGVGARREETIPAGLGSGRIARPASRSRACANSHGFPKEPRAIMMPAQFVSCRIASTSAGVRISPFPMTGIVSAAATAAISFQFAAPWYIWVRV